MNIEQFREAVVLDEELEDLHEIWLKFEQKPNVYLTLFNGGPKGQEAHIGILYEEEFNNDIKAAIKKVIVKAQSRMKELGVDV